MKNNLVIENVAKTMEVSLETAALWFDRITEEAVKELESGSLQLAGFGILRKEHVPTEIVSTASGETVLEPPKNTVLFEQTVQTERDFISSVAVRQLKLTAIDAKKLSITYEKILNKVLAVQMQLTLEKIGTFNNSGSTVVFTPDLSLVAAMNERYHYLKPVKIDIASKSAPPRPATPPTQQPTPAVPARTVPPPVPAASAAAVAHDIAPPPPPLPVPPPQNKTHEEEQTMTPQDQMTPYDDFIPPPPLKQAANKRVELRSQEKELNEIMQKPIEQLRNELPVENKLEEAPKVTERKLTPQVKPKRVSDTGFAEFLNPEKTEEEKAAKRRKKIIIGAVVVVAVIAGSVLYNIYVEKQAEKALALIEQERKAKLVESEKAESPKTTEDAKPAAAGEEPLVVKEEAKRVKTKADVPPATKPEPAAKPEPLKKPEPAKPAPAASGGTGLTAAYDAAKGGYVIVVASRTSKSEAEDIAKTYSAKGITTSVKSADVNGTTRWRIRLGQFESRQAANAEKSKLGSKIPEDAYIDPVK